jgi:hypothetical protein
MADLRSSRSQSSLFGLVIQGPLMSSGSDGEGNFTDFNCVDNILRIRSEFGSLFDSIVVSTWDDQDHHQIEHLRRKGFTVILNSVAEYSTPWNPDNRFRQYYSSLAGIRALQADVQYVVKTRSDTFLDFSLLISEFKSVLTDFREYSEWKVGPVHSLFFFKYRPLAVADFVLIGETRLLRKFFSSQFDFATGSAHHSEDWPEGDSVRKFLYALRSELPERSVWHYFPNFSKDFLSLRMKFPSFFLSPPESVVRVWETALRIVFSFSKEELISSLEIRGRKKELDRNKVGFYNDWIRARVDYLSFIGNPGSKHPPFFQRLWFFSYSEIRTMRLSRLKRGLVDGISRFTRRFRVPFRG